MREITIIVVLCVSLFQSLVVCITNSFTIFVFWIHRNKLKRTSFLLINLAFADLLVGLTDILVVGTFIFPQYVVNIGDDVSDAGKTRKCKNISLSFQAVFSATSVFFLVLIAIERAFALIWPLRHRVTSTKAYIYGIVIVWLAGITVGAVTLLILYDFLNSREFVTVYCYVIALSFITMCVCYLGIRKRLKYRAPGIDSANDRQNMKKISTTMFIVIAGSFVCLVPGLLFYWLYYWYPGRFSDALLYIFAMLYGTNSVVNPIIYNFRMQMFRETVKRMKSKTRCRRHSKRYSVNHCD